MAYLYSSFTLLATLIASQSLSSSAFPLLPHTQSTTFIPSTTTQLYNVMTATSDEEEVDEGLGGVRLANENLIKISGKNNDPENLTRYTQITSVEESALSKVTILAKGTGNEMYQDPGSSVQKSVMYAPIEAVKAALSSNPSMDDTKKIVVNFLGGDDLKTMEVLTAMEMLPSKNVEFHSLSFSDFPSEVCTVTIVSVDGNTDADDVMGKSLAEGEVYFHSGKWYTVLESDINTDEE